MNIHQIIQDHRASLAARAASVQSTAESVEAAILVQKGILREKMRLQVYPLIQRFCAELVSENVEAHATHSEEERGGDELHSWVVCAASIVITRGSQRLKADLQFVGSVTRENWKITAFHHFTGAPDVDATPKFIGTPAEIEPFVTRESEGFLLTLFPSQP